MTRSIKKKAIEITGFVCALAIVSVATFAYVAIRAYGSTQR